MLIDNSRPQAERVLLVGLVRDNRMRQQEEESLDELARLAWSAGAKVVGRRIQVRSHPSPATYVGSGLVLELKSLLAAKKSNCIIFDDALSPAQQRNLEEVLETKVIDRSILILDIFANRARTHAARMQVELAQLEYTLPRLTGAWVHFSRQYGGIGAKGPGETQLEIDRRQVRTKISQLKQKIARLSVQRNTQRKLRQDLFKVALVGYTNAGKSTLFNLLTGGNAPTADKLFTTLDSKSRQMSIGYPGKVIFSDTVGFIKKLPHQLVESFKSTLEEVAQANLLLHVVDCADPALNDAISQTRAVLTEIEADRVPFLMIYNKIDLNPDFVPPENNGDRVFPLSALRQESLAELKTEIVSYSSRFVANLKLN